MRIPDDDRRVASTTPPTTTTTSDDDESPPKKKRGRPGCDEDPRLLARNLRWLTAHSFFGLTLAEIAAGEVDTPSVRTVARGIASARKAGKAQLESCDDDEPALRRPSVRRRARPGHN